jgi:Asp-tRNA(Asn)/Glu-tRNA(Gln) amidotransferase A subunit family amidase
VTAVTLSGHGGAGQPAAGYLWRVRAVASVGQALDVVARAEPIVRAWAYLDPGRARREADAVDARTAGDARGSLPLAGLVLGVKDIFDTGDQPTEYGCRLYAGHRPTADASAVALLRTAGAVCLGKTVTAELACSQPGPTTNPHRATHTPGGSSSGSAAAVAAGMADVALGTQTAGSVIRPASFCGVYGFKPSFGTVSAAGVKICAPSLDTVGWFTRDPLLLDRVRICLTGRAPAPRLAAPPRLGLLRTDQWDACTADSQRAVQAAAAAARAAGAAVTDLGQPGFLTGLAGQHQVVMAYETARALAWEHSRHPGSLSAGLRRLLDQGRAVDPADYDAVLARRATALARIDELFAGHDAVLTPAVVGEAPEGLGSTGDPRCARLWSLLGLPSVNLPGAVGSTGLPVGVQLVGPPGRDAELLAITRWLAESGAAPRVVKYEPAGDRLVDRSDWAED